MPSGNQGGFSSLDIPPPPVAPVDVDPNAMPHFGMPEPPRPNSQGMDAQDHDETNFPGLDKEWMNFANGDTPSIEPGLPQPSAEMRGLEPRPIPSITHDDLSPRGPIFVEMETYGEFMGEIGRLNVKLNMMDEMLVRMNSLREKEDFELKRWHQSMDDLRKKLLYMDDALFESGR